MTDPAGTPITLDDFTGPTADDGGGEYEQYIGETAPTHDPFADYPVTLDFPSGGAPVVPATVSYSLADNLADRRRNIWSCWGQGVVVGWIGDATHQAECSDHNPDAVGVVHAIDPMVTGSHAAAVVQQCLAHPGDLQYVIHNRVIWSATVGWSPRVYTGSDPHTNHVHISGKHGGAHATSHTCTGYDLGAQDTTPAFNVCESPKPPVPPTPGGHAPGTRALSLAPSRLVGDDVRFVQRFIGAAKAGAVDGTYGPQTASGVRWYQQMRGIAVDGVVGPQTWVQMGVRWVG